MVRNDGESTKAKRSRRASFSNTRRLSGGGRLRSCVDELRDERQSSFDDAFDRIRDCHRIWSFEANERINPGKISCLDQLPDRNIAVSRLADLNYDGVSRLTDVHGKRDRVPDCRES